jgi:hypothetical protein
MLHIFSRIFVCASSLLVFVCAGFFAPEIALAHTPRFVDAGQHETTAISDLETSQALYGILRGSPHLYTFEISSTTPVTFSLSIPNLEQATPDVGLLLIKRTDKSVEEVARALPGDASWNVWYEWFGGDSYQLGPVLEETLDPGVYNLEVSTPLNTTKYVLSFGTVERLDLSLELYRNLIGVKHFFGKSTFAIIQSPFVYVPGLLLSTVGYLAVRKYRRRALASTVTDR